MSDTFLSLVSDHGASDAPPSAAEVIDVLSQALRDRAVPRCRILAGGHTASPEEGLALMQSFLAVQDPRVRQAVLHAVAALALPVRR